MQRQFRELREQLLRAGVAPRHVRRYLTELNEHLADLIGEEERAGRKPADAKAAALARLGKVEDLARTMTERPELRSWTARSPWLVLGAAPILMLACAWSAALVILWSGWRWFLAAEPTPFVPVRGLAIGYFGAGRMLYEWAPVLLGWWVVALTARQRLHVGWPAFGLAWLALLGATGMVEVNRPHLTLPGHVGISFLAGIEKFGIAPALVRALVLFTAMVVPYLVWRWRIASSAGRPEPIQ